MAEQIRKRGVGIFSDGEQIKQAIEDLKAAEFPMEQVSVVARQADSDQSDQIEGVETRDRLEDQKISASTNIPQTVATGAFWSSILVGLSSLSIPGAGPVLAAGTLGVALTAAVAGEGAGALATRNLVGALKDLGIPQRQAELYSDRLLAADYLVLVEGTDAKVHQAETVLRDRGIQEWGVYQPTAT